MQFSNPVRRVDGGSSREWVVTWHVVATLLLEEIDSLILGASRLPLVAADPVDQELPGGLVGVEPLPDVLVFANNLEDELEDDLHPLVVGDVQLHCVHESLEIGWNPGVEVGARSVDQGLKKTQEWPQAVKVLVDEAGLHGAEQLLELLTLLVVSVMAVSLRKRPDRSVSLGLDEEPLEESRLGDEDVGLLVGQERLDFGLVVGVQLEWRW